MPKLRRPANQLHVIRVVVLDGRLVETNHLEHFVFPLPDDRPRGVAVGEIALQHVPVAPLQRAKLSPPVRPAPRPRRHRDTFGSRTRWVGTDSRRTATASARFFGWKMIRLPCAGSIQIGGDPGSRSMACQPFQSPCDFTYVAGSQATLPPGSRWI